MADGDAMLVVGGASYGGWKSIGVTRGVQQCAGTFDLSVTELWPEQATPREINPGDACAVQLDGETVITGWVDEVAPSYTASSHAVAIRGRDATGDLVDCSAIHKTGQWYSQKLERIAADLCAPFNIKVSVLTDTGEPFPEWSIQPGESVFENLERAARQRAVLLVSDGRGGLQITRAGRQRIATALVLGQNIKACSGRNSHAERFSLYRVMGQQPLTDDLDVSAAAFVRADVKDNRVKRYRPLVVLSEDNTTTASARQRGQWEANVRAARGLQIVYTVQGWRHRDGLWAPDRLVPVSDPWMRIERDLYIASVRYVLDDGGTSTELSLTLPEAFTTLPVPVQEDMY